MRSRSRLVRCTVLVMAGGAFVSGAALASIGLRQTPEKPRLVSAVSAPAPAQPQQPAPAKSSVRVVYPGPVAAR